MKFVILCCLLGAAAIQAVQFEIVNVVPGPIWVGILGNAGKPTPENGGFQLDKNERRTINAPDDWAGRFWARTWCDGNSKHCQTGDCGNRLECRGAGGVPPVTLVEITLRGHGGQDFYDVSLVDGFNVKASIEPVGGRGGCRKVACERNVNDGCPDDLKVRENKYGTNEVIACNSACNKYNTDEYCCRGAFGGPNTCHPNNWQSKSASHFKSQCPDAYSYAYDDRTSTFTCSASAYKIVFS